MPPRGGSIISSVSMYLLVHACHVDTTPSLMVVFNQKVNTVSLNKASFGWKILRIQNSRRLKYGAAQYGKKVNLKYIIASISQ
jgi:hypothetical protein